VSPDLLTADCIPLPVALAAHSAEAQMESAARQPSNTSAALS
jgi:hypothetical protein